VVVGLAVAGTALLVTRGLVGGAGDAVVDPLLVATPLLLALAACIAVLRLYPLPLAAVSRALARRDGVVGQLGAAIALRSATVPVAPVLAMVVGVAMAVFSTVLVATIDRGAQTTVDTVVGADIRVDDVTGGEGTVASIAAVDGVLAVAGIDDAGPAVLRVDGVREPITLVIVDALALGALRGEDLRLAGEGLPVIVSADLVEGPPEELELVVEGEPVTVAGVGDPVAGIVATSRWVMADAEASRTLAGADFRPTTVLVDLEPGADIAAVSEAIGDLAGHRITTPESALAELRASPVVAGLRVALVAGLAIAGLLAVLALVLASVAGARARSRALSLLSTLGLSPRQSGGLAAWELAPTAIVSTVVGALLGLGLPFVVLAAVDLRPFTGGSVQPVMEIPWLAVGGIVAGFVLVVALTVFAVTAASRRTSAAVTLRMGDEPT
jgi:putative ABC transport system permease protein